MANKTISSATARQTAAAAARADGNYNAVLADTTARNPIVVCRVNCIDSILLRMHHEFPTRAYGSARGYRDYRDNFRVVYCNDL